MGCVTHWTRDSACGECGGESTSVISSLPRNRPPPRRGHFLDLPHSSVLTPVTATNAHDPGPRGQRACGSTPPRQVGRWPPPARRRLHRCGCALADAKGTGRREGGLAPAVVSSWGPGGGC